MMKHTICSILKNDSETERTVITWNDEDGAFIDEDSGETIENAGTCSTMEEARKMALWLWGDPVWGMTMASWCLIDRLGNGDDIELTAETKDDAVKEARAIILRMSQCEKRENLVVLTVIEKYGPDLEHAYDVVEID